MQGNPSARSRRANRSPQHNHGSSLATSLIVWTPTPNARNKNQRNQNENMNESTSSHSCFLRNVPHLHLQRSHNRDQRSKRHSKVSLRRQLQQPDQQIYRKNCAQRGHWQVHGMTTVFFVYIADLYQIIRSIMYVSICIDIKNNISKILKKRHRTKSHTKNRKNN